MRLRRPLAAVTLALIAFVLLPASADAKVVWLCKPGQKANPCEPSLTTTNFSPKAKRLGVEHVRRAKRRQADCFYVYPTVSDQKQPQATQVVDDVLRSIALYQAARYSRDCRVFAPVYRQVTVQGLLQPGTVTPEMRGAGLRRCGGGLARVPEALQPRPRRGADRPLAGHLRAATADPRGDRPEGLGTPAARVRGAARRQRHGEEGQRPRRRLQAGARLPSSQPDRLRDRLLDLQRARSRRTRSSAGPPSRGARSSARTRPRWAAARRSSRRSTRAPHSRTA